MPVTSLQADDVTKFTNDNNLLTYRRPACPRGAVSRGDDRAGCGSCGSSLTVRILVAEDDEGLGPGGGSCERQPPDQNLRRRLASDSPCRMPSSTAAGMADRSMRLMPIACTAASSALITSTADPLSVSAAISLWSCPAGVKRVFWPLVAATAPSREMI